MMLKPVTDQKEITKPKMICVEGKDDHLFLKSLVKSMGLDDQLDVRPFHGITKLKGFLEFLMAEGRRAELTSIGIVRDADNNATGAFQSVCTSLEKAGLPQPTAPCTVVGSNPKVGVLILPVGKSSGKLEDVCLDSVADDAAMKCVDEFFECLAGRIDKDKLPTDQPKARVRTFLVSRELLEESHFEFIQQHLGQWAPQMPTAPSVEKLHAFVAARFNPKLDLGRAAEAGYWDFNHQAFAEIKEFIGQL